jgi:hypothetical protein
MRRVFAFAFAVVVALGADAGPGGGADAPRLSLRSREKLPAPSPLTNAVYLKPTGGEMLGAGGFSPDNGRTWRPFTPAPDFDSALPHGYRRERFPLFVDPPSGRVVSILNSMDTPGVDPDEFEPPIALESYYLRYRVSTDGGRTYLFDEPIVQRGGKHTPEHPFDGVWKGKNAMFMGDCGSALLRTRAGKILVPAQACVLRDDGKLANPGGGFTYTDVRILIGTWRPDNRLEWDAAEPVQVDPKLSTRGMIEPTLAELPDGRLLMVMRGSNGGRKDPKFKIPGYKWFATSADGGRHWSRPAPWTYTDGSSFFSPSSMSQLIPHSTGRLLWVGNITAMNPRGNSPRYPLVVAEVSTKIGMLIRDSVTVIDDLRAEDKQGVELNAHSRIFEDRETGDLVIPMLRWSGKYKSSESYLYRIAVNTEPGG